MAKIQSNFNNSLQGWTTTGGTLSHDDDGNFLRGVEGGSGVWYFSGGPAWTGDSLADRFGATLQFRMRQDDTSSGFFDDDIRIVGANGTTLTYAFFEAPGTTFTNYSVDLNAYSNWQIDGGQIATEMEIRDVLADVVSFQIRGEHRSGPDAAELAYVRMSDGIERARDTRPDTVIGNKVISTFDKGGEGWSFTGDIDSFSIGFDDAIGTGYLRIVDRAVGDVVYAVAPSDFTGLKSGYYGGALSYEVRVSDTSAPFSSPDVFLAGTNGTTLVWSNIGNPGSDWTFRRVVLDVTEDWRVGSETGPAATLEELQDVLADVASLSIRTEFRNGDEVVGLDQVALMAERRKVYVVSEDGGSELLQGYAQVDNALDDIEPGQTLLFGRGGGDLTVDVDGLTIDSFRGAKDTITLGDGVESLEMVRVKGTFTVKGNGEDNTILISGRLGDRVTVNAGAGADYIDASTSAPVRLVGGAGKDTLLGGSESDKLVGGKNADLLNGGDGNDRLLGGKGPDTFEFDTTGGRDTVLDFEPGVDTIAITDLPAGTSFDDLSFGMYRGDLTVNLGDGNRIVLDGFTDQDQLSAADFDL